MISLDVCFVPLPKPFLDEIFPDWIELRATGLKHRCKLSVTFNGKPLFKAVADRKGRLVYVYRFMSTELMEQMKHFGSAHFESRTVVPFEFSANQDTIRIEMD